jgi:peptidoglycan/LPS O-acetylase OafA/YrhL
LSQGGNIFTIGFVLYIIPAVLAPESITNKLFQPNLWQILSKLTFIFSLVGGMIILFKNYSMYQMPSLYIKPVLQTTVTWAVYSGIISLILHLIIEAPLKKLGLLLFERKESKKKA